MGFSLSTLALCATQLLGCAGNTSPPAKNGEHDALPPLETDDLAALLPIAGLRWIVLTRPRAIAETAWLIPSIGRLAPEKGLSAFARAKGLDLRQIPEAVIASYESDEDGEARLYLVRHNAQASLIEKLFRARITRDDERVADRSDVVRRMGTMGTRSEALTLLGSDVAAFQEGGSMDRGPARIAALYGLGRLKTARTALVGAPLEALDKRLGDAPAKALAPGPFEGELARGLRGLLEGATAVGAAATPTARETIALTIAAMGDFARGGEAAAKTLLSAWNDAASAPLGRLLALDEPASPLQTEVDEESIILRVELDAEALFEGLAAATSADVTEFLR